MSPSPVHSSFKKLALEALAATAVVFALTWLIGLIPFQFGIFEATRELLADFSYTDLYYSDLRARQANTSSIVPVDKNIVLVNIGTRSLRSRSDLVLVLRAVAACQPKVVGLDAYFLPRPDSANPALALAMQQTPQLVVGAFLRSTKDGQRPGPVQPELRTVAHGFLNFTGDDSLNSTIRYFRPFIHEADTVSLSWSAELVKRYNADAYEALRQRHPAAESEEEAIRFQGNIQNFRHLEATELLSGQVPPAELRGKLILLGAMGEQAGYASPYDSYEDCHFTPLNPKRLGRTRPDMYGVVVEANIIAMMLHRNYVNPTPVWLEIGLAAIIGWGLTLLFSFVAERHPLWLMPIKTGVQFLLLLVLVYVVVQVYENYSRTIDITFSLAVLALTGEAVAFYEAVRDSTRNSWHWTHRKLTLRRQSTSQPQ